MITLVVAGIAALLLGLCKTLFWSGPFPPDSGWSQRQRELINSFKSPWTWKAWATYWVDEMNRSNPNFTPYQIPEKYWRAEWGARP